MTAHNYTVQCSDCGGTRERCSTCHGATWRWKQRAAQPEPSRRYLLVRTMGGGCDYTIGCGVATEEIETTETVTELLARCKADALGENGSGIYVDGDWELSEAMLYEITSATRLPLAEWKREKQQKSDEAAKADSDAKEHAEYERLRKKYEQKP